MTNSQTTAYVYGTTSTSGVFSNDVLSKVEYPDPSTGAASTAAANDESYTYNALGQKTTMLDRNGTTHDYGYDVLGREVSDVVPTGGLGSGVSNQTHGRPEHQLVEPGRAGQLDQRQRLQQHVQQPKRRNRQMGRTGWPTTTPGR